jgi:putative membrane protein
MMYYYGSFFPFHIFGFLLMVAFWAIVIYGLVLLVRKTSSSDDKNKPHDRSVEILKERYAKGEITKHEFEAMKKDLE